MILCVNANAAIDKTVTIPDFHLGGIHRPETVLALAGGKGCNVARSINRLGGQARVTGWVGGFAGRFIESELDAEGIEHDLIHTQKESRTCLSIHDFKKGTLTEIYERGEPLTANEVQGLIQNFKSALSRAQLVTLSGSLPPGVPIDFYTRLVRLAGVKGIPVFLDTSGPALKNTLEAGGLNLVKPNLDELADLAGQALPDLQSVIGFTAKLSIQYHLIVVVTLGNQGALAGKDGRVWWAQPPQVDIISAVGSGDATLAAWALAALKRQSIPESLQSGVAAGTANAMQLGAGRLRQADYLEILPEIKTQEY